MAVSFGTSGLRGPASDFTKDICTAYVTAFLEITCAGVADRTVYVGADLRVSSPQIVSHCLAAIAAAGWRAVNAGAVPTPALAAYALARRSPAVMVTGSHIPEIYNGIKFYRPDGEFLKEDETPVRTRAEALLAAGAAAAGTVSAAVDPAIAEAYVARYADAFAGHPLRGLKVGVDLHSAVGRDLTVRILEALGAKVHAFRRADHFIAVDTEAVDPADLARARQEIEAHELAAVISTDGDGDRPLVIDETGRQINGDVLGALTARHLGIATVATPLTSTSAIEMAGWFKAVIRTRIGSPYVVAAMAAADRSAGPVAGFEANGGFLTETDLELASGRLARLPTRDAILPIVAALKMAAAEGKPLSALAGGLPSRVMKADRLKEVAPTAGAAFLKAMAGEPAARKALDPRLEAPADINGLDGVRMTLATGEVVHFRQSGNAPELRCYVETDTAAATAQLLGELMAKLRPHVDANA